VGDFVLGIILCALLSCISSDSYAWSWVYTATPKKINVRYSELSAATNKSWCWEKKQIPTFSQLIVSWNAFRPERGFFTFFIQVRDAVTKTWYPWHRVAQWGKDIQRSFSSVSRRGTRFLYVRLEVPDDRLADAFRVRVIASKNAHLLDLSSVTVNTSNSKLFYSEVADRSIRDLPSVFIQDIPRKSQINLNHPRNTALCSPTSVSMLLGYLLKRDVNALDIAKGVHDHGLDAFGSWPFNTAHAFEKTNGKCNFHVERLKSFKQLHAYLLKSMPVVVSVTGPLRGGARPYKAGHLLVVVGFDRKRRKVWCHDPAFDSHARICVSYDLVPFLRAWERSRRLAYVTNLNSEKSR
jgi:hypothetical protein